MKLIKVKTFVCESLATPASIGLFDLPRKLGKRKRPLLAPGGGGGVLPYTGYIGTCRGIGYGFWRFSILK